VVAWLAANGTQPTRVQREMFVPASIVTSMVVGGPVTKALLRLADPGSATAPTGPARPNLLTGGTWIGALERIAVTGTLLARWPDGLALVLAVKGLGRYPELRRRRPTGHGRTVHHRHVLQRSVGIGLRRRRTRRAR